MYLHQTRYIAHHTWLPWCWPLRLLWCIGIWMQYRHLRILLCGLEYAHQENAITRNMYATKTLFVLHHLACFCCVWARCCVVVSFSKDVLGLRFTSLRLLRVSHQYFWCVCLHISAENVSWRIMNTYLLTFMHEDTHPHMLRPYYLKDHAHACVCIYIYIYTYIYKAFIHTCAGYVTWGFRCRQYEPKEGILLRALSCLSQPHVCCLFARDSVSYVLRFTREHGIFYITGHTTKRAARGISYNLFDDGTWLWLHALTCAWSSSNFKKSCTLTPDLQLPSSKL